MNEPVIIDAGTLTFNEEDMSATGLLVPFGVKCRSNLGEFEVGPGVFTLPEDTLGASLNVEHQREDVVGGIAKTWEQPEGVMGTFKFANTKDGRKAFGDAKSGERKHLSAEVAKVAIQNGKAIAGRLFAAAVVKRPAFEGATLLAAEDTGDGSELLDKRGFDAVVPDSGVLELHTDALPVSIAIEPAEGDVVTYTPEAAPAEVNTEGGSTVTATAIEPGQATTPVAGISSTLLAGAPNAPVDAITKAYELGSIFAAMATVKTPGNLEGDYAAAQTLLAELSDIKVQTNGGLTTAASGVIQPAWVGQLWQGKKYVRRFIDLATHVYGGINVAGRKGFKIDQGTALVQHWNGNKSDVPSGTASTSTTAATRRAYGYAADIAREFWDLEGGQEVIEAFMQGVVDSYAKITDLDALQDILGYASGTVATTGIITADGSRIVEPVAADYPAEYSLAMGMVIDSIDAVTDADDDPGFVLVNRAAWRQLRFTPKDKVPEYVKFAVKGSGEADADQVIVKRAPDTAFDAAGFDNTEPAVVSSSKTGIEFREQGETPIRLDALNIAKGGIDKAVIGYLETFPVRAEATSALGTKKA
ncbi:MULTISPECIES: hypothetical protein [unclassified Microbacterium]|uniref:hypothetical protein n=1 Tax=unclassified Microbacterium TaxID=2609290 RepID=UPI000D46A8B8|nr:MULTISPECIES: hypothetical protein [unclassified Microbacterium]PQZ60680.1 hypothetical protein CQ032_04030 [Microbacterium sp. MYb43]PQZ82106.1 hypothetical protein CQ031_01430 [Microbacterium sp. MYb40]PRB22964.1 hypothetical protein CQ037_18175 [Microbacterium sp. MYb50]PRB24194.1 hypothetical protein CQ040_02800 [Microbacterium sp. MYb54]PRB69678.1 hypothetical protein CQ021_02805 [Microbacterium sp. MYb24]